MLVRTCRVPILVTALALGVVTAAGAVAATTTPSVSVAPGSLAGPLTVAPQISTLPNGDRVLVFGSGPAASVAVLASDGRTVPFVRYAPNPHHAYVIPDSVLAAPGQFVTSQYEIPTLSVASPPATPEHYPLHILQINGVGLDGAAADGTTFLTNTDDVTRWSSPIPILNGVARVEVPAGHYSATTLFSTYDAMTKLYTTHAVTTLDVTVAGTGVTTVTADERTAAAEVTATTPRPAVNDLSNVLFNSTDLNGMVGGLILSNSGPAYVNPTAAAQVGKFTYQVLDWEGESPAGTADPYHYDVMFPAADHIDGNQSYKVDASKLATIHNTVDIDPGNTRHQGELMTASHSPGIGGSLSSEVFTVPGSLTTYYGAPVGDANYTRIVIPALPSLNARFPSTIFLQANAPTYAGPGETWRTWGHGPLTPQVGQYQGGTSCRACSDGGTVDLSLSMLQDSSQNGGAPFGPVTTHLSVYRDGAQVFSQDNYTGAELTGQAQQPGTYRMVYDQDLSAFGLTQSTVTHTDITVPFTSASDPKWTLPSGDFCFAQGTSTTPCSVLPVLNLNYQMATDDTNTGHGRMQALLLTVGHQSYDGAGSDAPATGASVSVSFDKGATWTAAKVISAGPDHFVALWKNSGAAGSAPWLKVTATDALGGSIAQTVANAYTIG
jgi:hypothetical protein